jgi:DNA-binding transcriptional regulator YhcF (GntR family)
VIGIAIDTSSSVPPFEQLRSQIAGLVARGDLAPGTRLATVRQLAADLGLAANTVARAYRELEADGVISTHGRRGTFVNSPHLEAPDTVVAEQAGAFVLAARRQGYSLEEATRLVERAWNG